MSLEIVQIPVLDDNYVYVLYDPSSHWCGVVDPGTAEPVLAETRKRGWNISHIFITHHHYDHVGGIFKIELETGAKVIAFHGDRQRIPLASILVKDGDILEYGNLKLNVVETPGHTSGHIIFVEHDQRIAFVGDTVFSLGCGRIFEGTPQQMWHSLSKIKQLPPDYKLYCTHEYTLSNAKFALHVDPSNSQLQDYVHAIKKARIMGLPTVPMVLGDELATNPFLRANETHFTHYFQSNKPHEVLRLLRELKNDFR